MQRRKIMRNKLIACAAGIALAGGVSFAAAVDINHGRELFESPALGGGTTGKSCSTCHAGGKRFGKKLFNRKYYMIMGMKKNTLADVVNVCIEKPLGGHAIDPQGKDMADLIAYMRSLVYGKKKN